MKTIFELSHPGERAYSLPRLSSRFAGFLPPKEVLRQSAIALPEVSELDLTRHFNRLSRRNMGIDTNFYPLGSCTMKFNPRVNEWAAALPQFQRTHPLAPDETVQGNLQVIWELTHDLAALFGMTAGTLLPNAGAQGEFTGVKMIRAYHLARGDEKRVEMLVADSAHGTNPATAVMAGFRAVPVPSDARGDIDLDALRSLVSEKTAGLMLTNPSTLGLFCPSILQAAAIVHEAGGLLYYDGANLNPMLGVVRPGDMGFDVMHVNLHKTFSTPHGGGGPGAGPVLCNDKLAPYLPLPRVSRQGDTYHTVWHDGATIGAIATFYGNFGILLRAWLYIKLHGLFGLRRIAEMAVLNANYLKHFMSDLFTVPFTEHCMHEFVVQADRFLDRGVKAYDIAKRLLDFGIHAPTVYFPLTVKECMLIEPTESESRATLDQFIAALQTIVREIEETPDLVKTAPHTLPVSRLDEVRAAKSPKFRYSGVASSIQPPPIA